MLQRKQPFRSEILYQRPCRRQQADEPPAKQMPTISRPPTERPPAHMHRWTRLWTTIASRCCQLLRRLQRTPLLIPWPPPLRTWAIEVCQEIIAVELDANLYVILCSEFIRHPEQWVRRWQLRRRQRNQCKLLDHTLCSARVPADKQVEGPAAIALQRRAAHCQVLAQPAIRRYQRYYDLITPICIAIYRPICGFSRASQTEEFTAVP